MRPGGKSILLILTALGISCRIPSTRNPGAVDRRDLPLEVEHVRGSVYVVEDNNYWKTNSLFYASGAGIVFFDTTYQETTASRMIWKAAARGRGDYLGVVLTDDRLFRSGGLGNFALNNIPLFMERSIYLALLEDRDRENQRMSSSFPSWIAPDPPNLRTAAPVPETYLDGKIQIFSAPPAFSPGNLLVHFPDEKIVYGGSLLSVPVYFRERIQVDLYRKILEQVRKWNPELIVSGHGEAIREADPFLRDLEQELDRLYPPGSPGNRSEYPGPQTGKPESDSEIFEEGKDSNR